MLNYRIQVFGKVQGVAFRYYTRLKAIELGIVGTVENRADGTVEIYAFGAAASMEKFVEWCKNGSPASSVSGIEKEEFVTTDKLEYSEFIILR